jgi:hypothetical protein
MGSMPYRMYDVCKKNKKLGGCWGLVDKISPAFELRNSGVPAVAMPACRVPAGLVTLGLFTLCGPHRCQSLRRVPPPALAGDGSTVVWCHPLCAALSWVLASRALRGILLPHHWHTFVLLLLGSLYTAHTYLKQPWQPLQVFGGGGGAYELQRAGIGGWI